MIKDYKLHFPPVLISEDEQALHNAVHDFVEKEIMPVREQLEDDLELQDKIRRFFVDMGQGLGGRGCSGNAAERPHQRGIEPGRCGNGRIPYVYRLGLETGNRRTDEGGVGRIYA